MGKRALVIIDLQNDYFPGGRWTLSGIGEAADNAVRLLRAARAAGDLVIHVRHENAAPEAPLFVSGTEGAEINAKVTPIDGEAVIVKHFPSSFRETDLKRVLDINAINDLLFCGAMSQMCIDSTVRTAVDLGYRCTVAYDACAARDAEFEGVVVPAALVHASFMASLAMGFASCMATDELVV